MDNLEFMECAECAAKPGSPALCPSCLNNRAVIEKLTGKTQGRSRPEETRINLVINEPTAKTAEGIQRICDEFLDKWPRLTKIDAVPKKITEKTYHLAMDFDCKETAEAVANEINKYLKKKKGETMPTKNKDFKPGDKVTVIINGRIVCVGTVSGVFHKYNVEIVTRDGGVRLFDSGSVYHGHNVKVEVTGEELPERLRVEEVEVLWKNIITYHSDSGCPVSMTIKMPAHMAKEYCEWIKEQE